MQRINGETKMIVVILLFGILVVLVCQLGLKLRKLYKQLFPKRRQITRAWRNIHINNGPNRRINQAEQLARRIANERNQQNM